MQVHYQNVKHTLQATQGRKESMKEKECLISKIRTSNEECEEDNGDPFSLSDFDSSLDELTALRHLEKMLNTSLALSARRNVRDYVC